MSLNLPNSLISSAVDKNWWNAIELTGGTGRQNFFHKAPNIFMSGFRAQSPKKTYLRLWLSFHTIHSCLGLLLFRLYIYCYQTITHRKPTVLNGQSLLECALVKRMVLPDECVSGHCISPCTCTHTKKWICFSGTQDWLKAAFVVDANREGIGQTPGNRPREDPHFYSHFAGLSTYTPKSCEVLG